MAARISGSPVTRLADDPTVEILLLPGGAGRTEDGTSRVTANEAGHRHHLLARTRGQGLGIVLVAFERRRLGDVEIFFPEPQAIGFVEAGDQYLLYAVPDRHDGTVRHGVADQHLAAGTLHHEARTLKSTRNTPLPKNRLEPSPWLLPGRGMIFGPELLTDGVAWGAGSALGDCASAIVPANVSRKNIFMGTGSYFTRNWSGQCQHGWQSVYATRKWKDRFCLRHPVSYPTNLPLLGNSRYAGSAAFENEWFSRLKSGKWKATSR